MRKNQNLKNNLSEREARWHRELQCTYGVEFWSKTYALAANIKYENKIKWLQYQINRNSLFTNYKVNKFKPHISPLCTFCSHLENFPKSELVSHLFYDCDLVLNLWQEIKAWLATLDINIPLERAKILFGDHTGASSSVTNFTMLCCKSFIWKAKFTTKELTLVQFQKYFYFKLIEIKNACILMWKESKFERWSNVLNYLSRLPQCIDARPEDVAILPDTV